VKEALLDVCAFARSLPVVAQYRDCEMLDGGCGCDEHLTYPRATVAEIYRALKLGGRLHLTVPSKA
jgi:hypothetical protein